MRNYGGAVLLTVLAALVSFASSVWFTDEETCPVFPFLPEHTDESVYWWLNRAVAFGSVIILYVYTINYYKTLQTTVTLDGQWWSPRESTYRMIVGAVILVTMTFTVHSYNLIAAEERVSPFSATCVLLNGAPFATGLIMALCAHTLLVAGNNAPLDDRLALRAKLSCGASIEKMMPADPKGRELGSCKLCTRLRCAVVCYSLVLGLILLRGQRLGQGIYHPPTSHHLSREERIARARANPGHAIVAQGLARRELASNVGTAGTCYLPLDRDQGNRVALRVVKAAGVGLASAGAVAGLVLLAPVIMPAAAVDAAIVAAASEAAIAAAGVAGVDAAAAATAGSAAAAAAAAGASEAAAAAAGVAAANAAAAGVAAADVATAAAAAAAAEGAGAAAASAASAAAAAAVGGADAAAAAAAGVTAAAATESAATATAAAAAGGIGGAASGTAFVTRSEVVELITNDPPHDMAEDACTEEPFWFDLSNDDAWLSRDHAPPLSEIHTNSYTQRAVLTTKRYGPEDIVELEIRPRSPQSLRAHPHDVRICIEQTKPEKGWKSIVSFMGSAPSALGSGRLEVSVEGQGMDCKHLRQTYVQISMFGLAKTKGSVFCGFFGGSARPECCKGYVGAVCKERYKGYRPKYKNMYLLEMAADMALDVRMEYRVRWVDDDASFSFNDLNGFGSGSALASQPQPADPLDSLAFSVLGLLLAVLFASKARTAIAKRIVML